MKAECAATWGAFCAMRGRILSADFAGVTGGAFLKESSSHGIEPPELKEKILRTQFGNALRKIEHFFPKKYIPLLQWLREIGDIFNVKLLMKNILFHRGNQSVEPLLLVKPAVRFSPPDPSDIKSISDLLSYYPESFTAYSLKKGNSLFEQNRNFFFFETGCDFGHIESLINIACQYPEQEKTSILSSISLMTAAWIPRLPLIRKLNSDAADFITASLHCFKKKSGRNLHRQAGETKHSRIQKEIFSPSWYFLELMHIREKIIQDPSIFSGGGNTS